MSVYQTFAAVYLVLLFSFAVYLVRRANLRSRAAEAEARSYERAAGVARREADAARQEAAAARQSGADFAHQAFAAGQENERLRGAIADLTNADPDRPERTMIGIGLAPGQRISRPRPPPPPAAQKATGVKKVS